MRLGILVSSIVLFLSCCKVKEAPLQKSASTTSSFNALSEEFLQRIKEGKDTQSIQEELAKTTLEELAASLRTDAQRYAFWVNIYNAYIITILSEHPEYYEDKDTFFSKDQITIAGKTISFDLIEHGILRKSQWKLGLGYLRKWFTNSFERKLRVDHRDYRIHFALNCGAKDCPPVAIYDPEKVNGQFENGTRNYLEKTTEVVPNSNEVLVTPLFSWFRGDFGGKKGTKKILKSFGLIESTKGIDLEYKDYNWTLDIDNFINL